MAVFGISRKIRMTLFLVGIDPGASGIVDKGDFIIRKKQ